MPHYDVLELLDPKPSTLTLNHCDLPELVHLDDNAAAVMTDFCRDKPQVTEIDTPMDDALHKMKLTHTHLLMVIDDNKNPVGIITTEDILGEKPIQLIQAGRHERHQITVKVLMTAIADVPCLCINEIQHARVGNIVNTLKDRKSHFALVIEKDDAKGDILRGLFNTSQISKQLHTEVASGIAKALSVSGLLHRSSD